MSKWTTEETNTLISFYQKKTNKELSELLPRKTRAAIRGKAERLCLNKSAGIDYTNQRLGSLIFLKRLSIKNPRGAVWRAQCDCGQQIDVLPIRIKRLKHPSCGCMRPVSFTKNPIRRTLENRLRMYKQRADRDSIDWCLTNEEFFRIIQQDCFYCGQTPHKEINAYRSSRHKQVRSKIARDKHKSGAIKVNGIDRVDNKIGYTNKNCVPCCQYCNYAKRERSHDDFRQWIQQLIEYQKTI